VIEKDNIQELFSKAFENQTSAVRPELWAGVQAKMAVAGVASTAAVATKGLSALTKWIIGSAAVGTVGVVTTIIALNSNEESKVKENQTIPHERSQQLTASFKEEEGKKGTLQTERISPTQNRIVEKPYEMASGTFDNTIVNQDASVKQERQKVEEPIAVSSKNETKLDERKSSVVESKIDEKTKSTANRTVGPEVSNGEKVTNKVYPEDTKEPVKVDLVAKVTHFPNVFTPNGDGSNDSYIVETENISNFKLTVIDQDNHVVFETIDPNTPWDGTFAGDKAKEGMYAAIVTGKQQNGKSFRDIQLFELRR
jgi:gliding motility-associated-like protein